MRLLVVSGSPEQRRLVAAALGPAYDLIEAADGREALRIAEEEDIDLVVTDETTEPFGGFGLARELKQMIDPPAVIVLLERAQDGWLARWSGADRWLLRPLDAFALADAADAVTRRGTVARATVGRAGPGEAEGASRRTE